MTVFSRIIYSILSITLLVSTIGCNKDNNGCGYFGDAEDLSLIYHSYECDGSGIRSGFARVEYLLASDLSLSYDWDIEGSTSDLDFININGSGPMNGFVRVKNNADGCFIYKEVDMLFDMPHGTIGNQVWIDNPAGTRAVYDSSDEPAVGIRVDLLDASKELLDTQTTDASGRYLFEHLPDGDYIVKFYKPDNLSFCPPNLNNNPDTDSDVNVEGYTGIITISECEVNLTIDAGLVR